MEEWVVNIRVENIEEHGNNVQQANKILRHVFTMQIRRYWLNLHPVSNSYCKIEQNIS